MNILYKHNAEAYEKVKKSMDKSDMACIIHATGTGKSFIALQLMLDYLETNPDKHIYYVTPLNGIKDQISEHIKELGLSNNIFKNVEFVTYQALTTKSRDELKLIDVDMLIVDEFHHLGAREWTASINTILESRPNIKIFGMSATSVRERGKSTEQDIAQTFFNGNISSTYDLAMAIADGVLPAPEYHAALTFLEDECRDLEEKVQSGKASTEEKNEYSRIISSIKKQISMMEVESTTDIIRKYIKSNGKYIYFCPKGVDIKELQDNFLKMLPEESRDNVEFYQVHSSEYSSLENKTNHHNFYNNIGNNGQETTNKLRVMFAIDMYNEGIHVPDIDGVIMGRNTQSEIVFYQQLGRALAVKKKNDNDETPITSPIVIDLMDNFRQILSLYKKTKAIKGKKSNEENSSTNSSLRKTNNDMYSFNFGMDEELIDLIEQLESVKDKIENKLSFQEKIIAAYEYLQTYGILPTQDDKDIKFSDGVVIGTWLSFRKNDLMQLSENNQYARALINELETRKGLSFEEKLKEAREYLQVHGELPRKSKYYTDIQFSDGTSMGRWLIHNKNRISNNVQNNDAMIIVQELETRKGLSFEEKAREVNEYLQSYGRLPKTADKSVLFSDGSKMGYWLVDSKSKIMESDLEEAKIIKQQMLEQKGLTFEEKKSEIYQYVQEHGYLPSQKDKTAVFSDGKLMGTWFNVTRQEEIAKLASSDEEAKVIMDALNKRNGLSFEEKMKETEDYYRIHGKLPKTADTSALFSDGTKISYWLVSKRKKIFEQSLQDDRVAEFANLIISTSPKFFNSTIKTLHSKEEFEMISDFNLAMQRLNENKVKEAKENEGRQI